MFTQHINLSNEPLWVMRYQQNNSQLSDKIDDLKYQYGVFIPSCSEIVPYEKPSSDVKQLKEN